MRTQFYHQALSVVWEGRHGEPSSGKDIFQKICSSKIGLVARPISAVFHADVEARRDAIIVRVTGSLTNVTCNEESNFTRLID